MSMSLNFFSSSFRENRLECFTTENIVDTIASSNSELLWKSFQKTNTQAYLAFASVTKKNSFITLIYRCQYHETFFRHSGKISQSVFNLRAYSNSELLANISQSWKGLPGTNTLAYLASLSVTKKKNLITLKTFLDCY